MHSTVKEISETLFTWLTKLQLGEFNFYPTVINKWNEHDWQVAKTIVFMHGMGPVWGSICLRGWQCEYMSEEFRVYLVGQYHQNNARIKKIQKYYKRLTTKLSDNNINYVPFKGIELAFCVYDDPAMRPMADIDLYIAEENREKVNEVFTELEFSSVAVTNSGMTYYPDNWLNKMQDEAWMYFENVDGELYEGENKNSPFSIDIHFEIKIQELPHLSKAFNRALMTNGKLSNTEHFIYLMVHAAKHFLSRSGRWLHLLDINLYAEKFQLNYQLVANKAAEYKVAHLLLIPIVLSKPFFSEFEELENLLLQKIGFRHKFLLKKLILSEMSFCYPWAVNPFFQLLWVHQVKDISLFLLAFKNRKKNTLIRKMDRLESVPGAGKRLLGVFRRTFLKVPREGWRIFASHNLNPKQDWK
ncbi:nucleotidyltransferase family protein [Aliikangiella sp. IMCC44359]|uniref:nucleotidyltransferase family protein n=1 Tax=Aliikangiella sp. IMCC44359 TaxID=3459125 RepID=UPI00403AD2FA